MGAFTIEYEPRLVEEAVIRALRGRAEEQEFRDRRDRLYEIDDQEEREAGFRELHLAWFERLGFGREVDRALQEQPSVLARAARCLVVYAPSALDEGAELFVSSGTGQGGIPQGAVLIRLAPETLALTDRLRPLLRHELLHIADMLNPRFGYEPSLPPLAAGPAHVHLVRDRYRVLWDSYVDGRLARLGWAPAAARTERLADFARAFPMLGQRTEEIFHRLFNGTAWTHRELLAFAIDPGQALGRIRGESRSYAKRDLVEIG